MDRETEIKEILGEVIYVAFRKASDSVKSEMIWKLMREMPNEEYNGIIDFVYECIKHGMK